MEIIPEIISALLIEEGVRVRCFIVFSLFCFIKGWLVFIVYILSIYLYYTIPVYTTINLTGYFTCIDLKNEKECIVNNGC